ncbi:SHOCT domain-containing protein [Altererythrobacter sp. GH1-8]|uniref:SHOCT domain-containing protein n=1 Tax=Altererythrobacter sp. GH1-8 TaxID=3349333 RepID=UPI00374CA910
MVEQVAVGAQILHQNVMQYSRISIGLLAGSLLVASPSQAMPDNAAEIRTIVETQFAGNANAYVEKETGDFRRIGCRGRIDLMQQLLGLGLDIDAVDLDSRTDMFVCAIYEKEADFLRAFLTPKWLAEVDEKYVGRRPISPLMFAVDANDYSLSAVLLANKPGYYFWRGGGNDNLTREGQLLLGAYRARKQKKDRALQAFVEALPDNLIADSRDDAFVDKVEDALRGRNRTEDEGGGGGGSLFRAVMGGVAGGALGGTTGAALGFLGAGSDDAEGEQRGEGERAGTDAPGFSSEQRRLATYVYAVPYSGDDTIMRATLGLQLAPAIGPRRGLLVQRAEPDGPGAAAGIQRGDLVTNIAGMDVEHNVALYDALEQAGQLDRYEVKFKRDSQEKIVSVATQLTNVPQALAPARGQSGSENGRQETTGDAASKSTNSTLEELSKLGDLRDRGIISDEEFEAIKEKILEGS